MSDDHVLEQLTVAVGVLAVSGEPIQSRLFDAAISALDRLQQEDFDDPEESEAFRRSWAALTAHGAAGDEGSLRASTSAMTDEQAVELAREIWELYSSVLSRLMHAQG